MTEAEARSAVESACQRADVTLVEFAFYDRPGTYPLQFAGRDFEIPPFATHAILIVVTSKDGRKESAAFASNERPCADLLERFVYDFAVDWLVNVQ